jgi:ligand-binding SRPBCC domain-containing protein
VPDPTLTISTRFLAPVEEVWRIKTDPALLDAEFRPDHFRLDAAAFARLFQGTLPFTLPAKLHLLGLPIGLPWPVTIDVAEPLVRYRDRSTNLLYRAFAHEHLFTPDDGGCLYTDRVTFTPRFLPGIVAALTRSTFRRRHANAARHLPVDPTHVGRLSG